MPARKEPKRVVLRPALSLEQARKQFEGKRLTTSDYDRLVETSERGVDADGATKYLFLRDTLHARLVQNTTAVLRTLNYSESNHTRLSLGKKGTGGGTAMGWIDKPKPRLLKPSRDFPFVDQYLLMWLLVAMSERMRKYLPDEWQRQVTLARKNGFRVLGGPNGHPDIPRLEPVNPIFSTITLNKNVPFRSHADGGNKSMACLAAFGEFSGSYLCLPRFRVAFDLRPGDLLIADTNHEQHGSISPRTGTRYSVVAYLRTL